MINLTLSSIHIDEFGGTLIESLCGHPSLERLQIGFSRLGNIGYCALGKVLKHSASKLKDLCIRQDQLDDQAMHSLSDALMGINKLQKLCLDGNRNITSVGWQAFSTVLRHPNCNLATLDLTGNSLNDEGADVLGSALIGSAVKDLNLSANESISSRGWQTLLNQLSHTSIEKLDCRINKIDDDGLAVLVSIITLNSIHICNNRPITPAGWRSFFNSLQSRGAQLVQLDISHNKVGDVGVAALGRFLNTSSNTLGTLNMHGISGSRRDESDRIITSQGWVALFTSLHGSNLDLVKLHLGNNNIDDEGMQLLIPLLSRMSSLKHLTLNGNRRVTPAGWQACTQLLQSPNFALERLDLAQNNINDNTLIPLTSALVNNKTLQQLDLYDCLDDDENESIIEDDDSDDEDDNERISKRGLEAVSTLLCNKSSILDTYNSNHILHDLDCDPSCSSLNEDLKLPGELSSYLELNKNKDKVEVARQKILQTHFSTEDNDTSSMQELLDMELEVMPAVITWIGRPTHDDWKGKNVSGLSTMFSLLRRVPDLFDSSPQKKNPFAGKRKREMSI